MHDTNVKLCSVRRCLKTIITFGYCDIRNNEGLAKSYQQRPNAKANGTYPLLRALLFRISQKPHPTIVCPLVWAVCVWALLAVAHKYVQARRVPFFFSYGGPVPFHPYLSGEPRLSQQHRSLTFSDKTIIVTRPYNFVDPAWGKIIFLSLGCLWQSSFFPSYFNIYFLFFLKNIHSVWMTPGKPSAWIKYALRVYGCHLALIQQRFENLVRDVSGAWHSVCFPDSLFSLSKLMCFYTYVCFTLPANRGLSIFLDHPNSKDLCAQDIFTLAYYSVFTVAYGFLIGILP